MVLDRHLMTFVRIMACSTAAARLQDSPVLLQQQQADSEPAAA
jgi:hypothetical protein